MFYSFERIGVRDIGRKSFSISLTTSTFGIGITFAFFQESGMQVSWIEALKMSVIGEDNSMAKSFEIQLGMLSSPGALERLKLLSLE